LSIHRFQTILKYKADWQGKVVIEADRWFASSKLCSSCGYKNKELVLADREWTCICGEIHDRDINAAKNLKNIGLSSPEFTPQESRSLDRSKIEEQNVLNEV